MKKLKGPSYFYLTNLWFRNLKGFTLMEQLVVMALTAILVLMGFTAILNFHRLVAKVRDNAIKDRNVYFFRDVMESDFRDSEKIGWDGELYMKKKETSIRYQFNDSFIIREAQESRDTFRFSPGDIQRQGANGNDSLLESISFNLRDELQSYRMTFFKQYPDYKIWEAQEYGN